MATEDMTICPLCGVPVKEDATQCPTCGAAFAENEYVCPHCGAMLHGNELVCRACGMDFGEKEFACPLCSAPVSADAIVCLNCGAEFAEESYRCTFCGARIERDTSACPSCDAVFFEKPIEEPIPGEEEGIEEGEGAVPEEEDIEKAGAKTKMKTKRLLFPFVAMVGQDMMKRSLILNAINPAIGGTLLRGQRGCGKSVAVRGLSEILPPIDIVKDCRFSCDPNDTFRLCWECRERLKEGPLPTARRPVRVVTLPLNATEDRVVGSIDIDKILTEGLKAFEPGILAEANRGILYVDEINLLDDFLVDVLLDAAAMGVCVVEREAVSVSYPAKFLIVGSMNPEEGGLRPQLLDRIALVVDIVGIDDLEQRKKIVYIGREATRDMVAFRKKYEPASKRMRARIIRAQKLLPRISMPEKYIEAIGNVSVEFKVDGHRPDMMMERTALANAAYEGRDYVTFEDLMMGGEMVMPHRLKRDVFEAEEFSRERLESAFRTVLGEET